MVPAYIHCRPRRSSVRHYRPSHRSSQSQDQISNPVGRECAGS